MDFTRRATYLKLALFYAVVGFFLGWLGSNLVEQGLSRGSDVELFPRGNEQRRVPFAFATAFLAAAVPLGVLITKRFAAMAEYRRYVWPLAIAAVAAFAILFVLRFEQIKGTRYLRLQSAERFGMQISPQAGLTQYTTASIPFYSGLIVLGFAGFLAIFPDRKMKSFQVAK